MKASLDGRGLELNSFQSSDRDATVDIIKEIFNGNFMPHGHCLLWRGDLLFLHVGGDLLTFTAYMLIPVALVKLVKSRDDFRFNWLFLCRSIALDFLGHDCNRVCDWRIADYSYRRSGYARGRVHA